MLNDLESAAEAAADEPAGPTPQLKYGVKFRIQHVFTGHRLHSHDSTYPDGSGQQQVTCFGGEDDNDWFMVNEEHGGDPREGPVEDGAIIRLQHVATERNLHSHRIESAVTHQQEVSCFGDGGNGDENCNWRVLYGQAESGHEEGATAFRLQHVNTCDGRDGHYLHSHPHNYPDWGFGQQEVTVFGGKDGNDLWRVQAEEE